MENRAREIGVGLELSLSENLPAIPVLLTSGFAEDVARAGEALVEDLEILRKPYTGAELAQALRRALDGS